MDHSRGQQAVREVVKVITMNILSTRQRKRIYYLKAKLRPGGCRCAYGDCYGTCPYVPVVSTIPNVNIRSGYGKGKIVINWDPNSKLGLLEFNISYHKLYSYGNLTPARIVGVKSEHLLVHVK